MILVDLFISFFKVGLLGFGGGLAIVRLIYDSVQPFMDMSREMFANIVAISQATPGPLAVNTATFVGFEAAGIAGAAAATLGVVLPEFIIVSIVSRMMEQFRENRIVSGALAGIRPAVMGLIGAAAVTLVSPALASEGRLGSALFGKMGVSITDGFIGSMMSLPFDVISVIILIATVLLVTRFKRSPISVLIIMGCIGALLGV